MAIGRLGNGVMEYWGDGVVHFTTPIRHHSAQLDMQSIRLNERPSRKRVVAVAPPRTCRDPRRAKQYPPTRRPANCECSDLLTSGNIGPDASIAARQQPTLPEESSRLRGAACENLCESIDAPRQAETATKPGSYYRVSRLGVDSNHKMRCNGNNLRTIG